MRVNIVSALWSSGSEIWMYSAQKRLAVGVISEFNFTEGMTSYSFYFLPFVAETAARMEETRPARRPNSTFNVQKCIRNPATNSSFKIHMIPGRISLQNG
jgi:hypothetical protein